MATKREKFLEAHPTCIYCGRSAETIDHFPPRAMFLGRHAPETYEFPACGECNAQGGADEKVLAVLARPRLAEMGDAGRDEWQKLTRSLHTNDPDLVREWTTRTRREVRQDFISIYGREKGNALRRAGYHVAYLGPRTQATLRRIVKKTAQALYYKHTTHILDGFITYLQMNSVIQDLEDVPSVSLFQRLGNETAVLRRCNRDLSDQFIYWFAYANDPPVLSAIVAFSPQLVFQILAVDRETERLAAEQGGPPLSAAENGTIEVTLHRNE